MITKYSVVRYLPHPLSGEMINIGVVAWSDNQIEAQFVKNWARARAFGREDVSFLRDFVEQVDTAARGQGQLLTGLAALDAKQLERIAKDWSNSIQFSEVRTSLRAPKEVIEEVSSIYLPELPHPSQKGRSRHVAAMLAWHSVSQVLIDERGPDVSELIRKQYGVRGKFDEHLFDVVVANGRPFLAAQGLSFEKSFTRTVQKDVDATAWAIDDVRKLHRSLPMAVLALAPASSAPVQKAKKLFQALNADMVSEIQIDQWVRRKMKAIPATASLTD